MADPFLALAADVLDDAERTHIANANRLRQLTRTATDSDGEDRGFGLDESHPDVARLAALVDLLARVEHDATLNLNRLLRKHPLYPFLKGIRGVGDKQAARLLAAIGDPYWNDLHDRPRTVSELWAYCGLRPGQRRTRGVKSNWSTIAKTRAWLVIESCMKQLDAGCKTGTGVAEHVVGCSCSPYRVVVDERRTRTATTNPDWTPKHSQLDGMRVASKALLRDLWREAKRLHDPPSGQVGHDAHTSPAAGALPPADQNRADTR